MTKNRQKMKRKQFLIKTHHKIDGKFSRQRCLDPDPVFKKCMDPDLVCPERLYPEPDPVNIRPDPQPCWWSKFIFPKEMMLKKSTRIL